jgi:hypothetical protein
MGDIVDGMFEDGRRDWAPGWTRRSFYSSRRPPADVHCKHCGEQCAWRETEDGWRLASGGKLHACNPVADDEFEDLTK